MTVPVHVQVTMPVTMTLIPSLTLSVRSPDQRLKHCSNPKPNPEPKPNPNPEPDAPGGQQPKIEQGQGRGTRQHQLASMTSLQHAKERNGVIGQIGLTLTVTLTATLTPTLSPTLTPTLI